MADTDQKQRAATWLARNGVKAKRATEQPTPPAKPEGE